MTRMVALSDDMYEESHILKCLEFYERYGGDTPPPAEVSEAELDRLRETNRKLHRRVQISEATAQSVQDQLGDWIDVFSSSFYRTEGRRQNERGFIIYILRDIRRRAAKLADRAALTPTPAPREPTSET